MHIPNSFVQQDEKKLLDIIRQYPFTTLIINTPSGVEAFHMPLILKFEGAQTYLQGHVAKVNPLWEIINEQSEVLMVFNGPNCYISPNHYPTKQQTGRAVPTWNYVAVHVKGKVICRFDDQFKLDMLNTLTEQHEQYQQQPWSIKDAPEQYIQRMLPAIVGLEIQLLSMTGQWKLSQNQPQINQQGVIDGLAKEGLSDADKIATLVKQYLD